MAKLKTVEADRINVAGRAGEAIVQRKRWDVEAVQANDVVVIGYLPAGHRIHAPLSQMLVAADVPNADIDLVLIDGSTTHVLIDAGGHTTGSTSRDGISDYDIVETIGTASYNREVALRINTAPATFAGSVSVDLGYFPL